MLPLKGLCVLDFSTLLPGPMATQVLADAGAEVIKIERPGRGDEMRSYQPQLGETSVNFHMLNGGKRSVALDLKSPQDRARLQPLLARADIVIEQFRPGVMARLGLDYAAVRALNPGVIYCSITSWGQEGPKAAEAAHDLNFLAETGVLGLTRGSDGAPVLPPILAGDIAGGTYPALVNILLALLHRQQSGEGAHLDIPMAQNMFPFLYWALGNAGGLGQWPRPGAETVTGGSPRYAIYATRDGRHIAAAPLEDKFWARFCELIGLPEPLRDDSRDPEAVRAGVAAQIAARTAADWQEVFAGQEICCSIVRTLEEALADPHWQARGVFARQLRIGGAAAGADAQSFAAEGTAGQGTMGQGTVGQGAGTQGSAGQDFGALGAREQGTDRLGTGEQGAGDQSLGAQETGAGAPGVGGGGGAAAAQMPALPSILCPPFRRSDMVSAPALGEANAEILGSGAAGPHILPRPGRSAV